MFANNWKNYIPQRAEVNVLQIILHHAPYFVFFYYLLFSFAEEGHLFRMRRERRGCFHSALDQRQTRMQNVAYWVFFFHRCHSHWAIEVLYNSPAQLHIKLAVYSFIIAWCWGNINIPVLHLTGHLRAPIWAHTWELLQGTVAVLRL